MFAKVKHFRGKDLKRKQLWVFGMKERESGKTYMEIVKTRNAATLLKIIYERCHPRTVIYSDLWSAYRSIAFLDKDFVHMTVNHSLHFVDPQTKVHTNGIESVWRIAKKKIKSMNGIKRSYIQPYLYEFMWRRKYVNNDLFLSLLDAIKQHYPLNGQKKPK